jgi:hypothetical protein
VIAPFTDAAQLHGLPWFFLCRPNASRVCRTIFMTPSGAAE